MADKDPFHLLVVDDDEMNRDLLSRRLMRQGYIVSLANNGSQALDHIRKEHFDLVLLDVMMPGIDGLEVLTTIRESHSIVDLPVILVTARDQSGDVAAALGMGANDYVTKPINFPVLFARVQTQLNIKGAGAARAPASAPAVAPEVPSSSGARSNERSWSGTEAQRATPIDFPTVSGDNAQVGDYEILGELGRGGMGVVYKARHLRMNRIVALKVIDKERLARADAVTRFYQEIEAAAKLLHPNVVLAYDAGQVGETHFFAMEYVEGQDLDRVVRESGPLPVSQACDFIRQAAVGLQHAYERGLVHRDIKPSNLLVTWHEKKQEKASSGSFAMSRGKLSPPREAIVKILDLGLALLHEPTEVKPAVELTREGRVVGSVDYMAPEQWMNAHKVDVRADLYSLGCTFYYLLTAKVPFPGDESMEKMLKHHLDQPVPLEQHRPEVPAKVAAVVRRLMSKRREDRYQTPGELAELLKWICQELG